jgi:hypothetical protein
MFNSPVSWRGCAYSFSVANFTSLCLLSPPYSIEHVHYDICLKMGDRAIVLINNKTLVYTCYAAVVRIRI